MRYLTVLIATFFAVVVGCAMPTEKESSMYDPRAADGLQPNMPIAPAAESWSATGSLFTPDAVGATRDVSIGLQQQFKEAGVYTVSFNLVAPTIAGNFKVPRAVAIIQWTCAGNAVTSRVTIANGVSISGPAEHIVIKIVDDTIDDPGGAEVEYNVALLVTKGVRATSEGTPLLVTSITMGVVTGAPQTLQIPKNSGINAILVVLGRFVVAGVQSDLTYKDYVVSQLDPAGNFLMDWKPTAPDQWVPLVPGASSVEVGCLRVNGIINITVLFGING